MDWGGEQLRMQIGGGNSGTISLMRQYRQLPLKQMATATGTAETVTLRQALQRCGRQSTASQHAPFCGCPCSRQARDSRLLPLPTSQASLRSVLDQCQVTLNVWPWILQSIR